MFATLVIQDKTKFVYEMNHTQGFTWIKTI